MSEPIVDRVLASSRYRAVDRGIVERLVAEEVARSRNADDAVKRVKRRLHQVVGAFGARGRADAPAAVRAAWSGDLDDPRFRAACRELMGRHASTAERVDFLDGFHAAIWEHTGVPGAILDVGSGLHPIALPWMGIGAARFVATDIDGAAIGTVGAFLALVGQPHEARVADAVVEPPDDPVDVALLLKLVPTLDRQDPEAATRLLGSLRARHAVVSFPARSLGGRAKGMERAYRARVDRLVADVARVSALAEASVPSELVFVLTLDG